ncbi:MAG: cation:proton antiporter [bacterium]|nr:cation:proton antiporter [bacterium]
MPKDLLSVTADLVAASTNQYDAAVAIGILLLASLLAGILADWVRIPKVTAYLLAGMVVGPSLLNAISVEHMQRLEPLTQLAMALVLLELGCAFPLAQVRPILRHATALSAGELLTTFFMVALAVWLFGFGLSGAVLLGALALATAPATTVLVLKECNSEGPVTELAGVLVALNNIVAIIAFEILFLVARLVSAEFTDPIATQLSRLTLDIGGACLLGIAGGLVISFCTGLLSQRRWLVMVIAVAILMLGLCATWHLPYMLAFLIAGVVVVNTSESADQLLFEQEKIAGLLVVVFFAVHGGELQLSAFLAAGLIGLVYIVARSAGKVLGVRWAAMLHREGPSVRRYLGSCMLAQAGAAIALSSIAADRWPELGERLEVIILGSVVFFEIVGPMLIRWSVLQAGEVPLARAVFHSRETPSSQVAKMWMKATDALGWSNRKTIDIRQIKVVDIMRENVAGLLQTAGFDDVIEYIRRSHDNTYVVIDDEEHVVGLIRYDLLSDIFFDASVDELVCAEDLSTPAQVILHPQDEISKAIEVFRYTSDDILPVVSVEPKHRFLGVIRRSDVTALAIRFR